MSNGTVYLTTRFAEENPRTIAALYEAPRRPVAMIKLPGTTWDVAPHGTLMMARFLKRAGMIAAEPAGWKELYLPLVHGG